MGLAPGLFFLFFFLVVGLGSLRLPGRPGGLVGHGLVEHECGHGELGMVEVGAAAADVKS